ncbi:restriction endonuclease subunit S [Streptomyces canus]|uniref:restriction endonuclease subunit S n=1 Tax=Streptomyces canus TaxID=58343 RepID=UPI00340266A6
MSGMEATSLGWAPAIPSGWKVVPLNFVAKMGTGHTPDRNKKEYWENCTIPWVTTPDVTRRADSLAPLMETEQQISELGMANSAAVLHPADTVMLSRTASVGYSVRIGRPMATTQAFVTWHAGPDLDPRYLLLALRAMQQEWRKLAYGSTHLTIYMPDLESIRIPLPPLEEQRRIADFLDAETARIDRMALAAERSRKLLAERRWTTVHTLATGSDRSVPRRNPGLGWVQEVPTSWPVVPLKFLARLGSGHTPSRSRPEYWQNCTIPWISLFDVGRMRDVRQVELTETTQQISELGMANSSACLHPAGTVVLSRTASVGFSTIMGVEMAVSQHFVTWTCGDSLLPTYLLQLLRAMRQYFESVQVGTTNVTVFMPDLYSIRVPLPRLAEQEAIVERIDVRTREIDALASRFDRQVSLLRERRQALITAAVTGQFDVSTASGRNVTDGVTA